MSLGIDRIVDVQISVSQLGLERAGYGIMNIIGISDVIPIAERVRTYEGIDEVAEDFATTDEEYIAANIHFSQSPKPTSLYISRRAASALPASLLGGANAEQTIATWAAISDGAFDVDVDGVEENVTACDFSSVVEMGDVAAVIEAAFSGTCTWDDNNTRFILNTATTGATASITFTNAPAAGTDITSLMDTLSTSGGSANDGVDAEDIQTSLNAIETLNSKWYGYSFTSEVKDGSITSAGTIADVLDAAAWAESRYKTFWNNSADANTLVAGNTSNVSYQLSNLSYSRSVTSYSQDDYLSQSAFARGATVDFEGTDTAITYMFKAMPSITATDLSSSQANAAQDVNCNYYANFGTALSGDSVPMYANGQVANGRFIDEVIGLDWLLNRIETDLFNVLCTSTTKIPQTDIGVAKLAQALEEALSQAVTCGLAAAGTAEIGGNDVFLEKGYYVFAGLVEDQGQTSREAREAPPISFVLKGAGAIHGVTINGTFVR